MEKGESPYGKSSFPRWIRKLDPWLEAEERNTLFQFFHQRAMKTPYRFFLFNKNTLAGLSFLGLVILGIKMNLDIQARGRTQIHALGLLFLLAIGHSILCVWINRKRKLANVPRSLHALFLSRQEYPNALRDLWLCGVRDSEIAEALYLEGRRDLVKGLPWASALFAAGMVVGGLYLLRPDSLMDVAAFVAFLSAGFEFGRLFVEIHREALIWTIVRLIKTWEKRAGYATWLAPILNRQLGRSTQWISLGAIGMLALALTTVLLSASWSPDGPGWGIFQQPKARNIWLAASLLFAAAFYTGRRILATCNEAYYRNLLSGPNNAFQGFVWAEYLEEGDRKRR